MVQPNLLLLLLLTLILPFSSIADNSIGSYCATPFTSSKTNSTITTLLADLVASASVSGFATSSSGHPPHTLYGLAQCRGDVGPDDCTKCLTSASNQLPIACPSQSDARIWYDFCFMRYGPTNFIGNVDTSYAIIYYNVNNAQDPKKFVKQVSEVMTKASSMAVQPGSESLGRVKKVFQPYVTLYGLAQCTRDLRPLQCAQCLSTAVGQFAVSCGSSVGCQVSYSSCMARYEIYPFFFPLEGGVASLNASFVGEYTKKIVFN